MIHRTWFLAGALLLPLMAGCGKKEPVATEAVEKFGSPWSSEEHWMVGSVVRDLQGMGALAGVKIAEGTPATSGKDHEFQVGSVKLVMAPSCWDTASYQALLGEWKADPSAPKPGPDLIHDLLTPTSAVLQKTNLAVSARIQAAPSDPLVHEEAAFLLGVFGTREYARQFGDLRPLVCRMTAHLAVASHLRGNEEMSLCGRWARVFFDFHAGRPVQARELAGKIPVEGDSGRWKRMVDLLITGDWRRGGDLGDPSLAESIALARALKEHRGNPQMLELVGARKDLQEIPEWSRQLSAQGRSVEEGHLAMRSALGMELMEIAGVFKIGDDPKPAEIAKHLRAEGPSMLCLTKGEPRVIGDADWASYFRRHLFACGTDIASFVIKQWDEPEAAAEWEGAILPYLRELPGHELVEPFIATKEDDYLEDLRKTADYLRKNPEQVPMGLWFDYRFPVLKTTTTGPAMPDQAPWFREVSPPGTAHSPQRRIRFTAIQKSGWVGHIERLHGIDPWDPVLCYELAENTGNNFESVKRAWGEVREYSIRSMKQILESPSLSPEQRIETLRTLVELDPSQGLNLGAVLVAAGKPEEAIKAYETAFEGATDRVAVSNKSQWMIWYYKSKGMDAEARGVADHNEEVYSHRGLVSALGLAIMEKDTQRANKLASAIRERYGDPDYLPVANWADGTNTKLAKSLFPEGIKEVKLADFQKGSVVKGVRIKEFSETMKLAGLRQGDLIVAVDGKRVESFRQYFMLMASEIDPNVRLIFRRGKQFVELDCQLPNRRIDSDMADDGN